LGTLYEEVKSEKGADYVLVGEGESSLSEIPVAVIYGRKTGYLMSKQPLLDLAEINIAHYQKYSDYSEGLRMCIPQLCFNGLDANQAITVIGHHTFHVVRPDGDVWFAEPTGAGLEAQRKDLQGLEAQMARLGLAIMVPNAPSPDKTATEIFARHIEADSDLATAARSLKDGLAIIAPVSGAPPENNRRPGPPRNAVFWLLATLSVGAATSVMVQHGLWGGFAVFIVTIGALLLFRHEW
jgi:hypothetical protein